MTGLTILRAVPVLRRWLEQASQLAATSLELAAAYVQARQRQLLQWWWQASIALASLAMGVALALAALLWSVPTDQRVAWAIGLAITFVALAAVLLARCVRMFRPEGSASGPR